MGCEFKLSLFLFAFGLRFAGDSKHILQMVGQFLAVERLSLQTKASDDVIDQRLMQLECDHRLAVTCWSSRIGGHLIAASQTILDHDV